MQSDYHYKLWDRKKHLIKYCTLGVIIKHGSRRTLPSELLQYSVRLSQHSPMSDRKPLEYKDIDMSSYVWLIATCPTSQSDCRKWIINADASSASLS